MSTYGPKGTDATEHSRARAYRLVSHAYRRALVEWLDGRDGGVALADAAREVAVRNSARSDGELPHGELLDVYAALHHAHVPTLVEAGVVAHDRDRNVVSLTERGRAVAAGAVDDARAFDDAAATDGSADSAW